MGSHLARGAKPKATHPNRSQVESPSSAVGVRVLASAARRSTLLVVVFVLVVAGCKRARPSSSSVVSVLDAALLAGFAVEVRDELGRSVKVLRKPERVVCLLPSFTETLVALGVGDNVVGVDDYSDYPEVAKRLPRLGGLYDTQLERTLSLKPDLIFVSGQNQALTALARGGAAVWAGDARKIEDVYRIIEITGKLVGRAAEAAKLVTRMQAQIAAIEASVRGLLEVRVYYELDPAPYTVGPNSFIGVLISIARGENIVPATLGDFPKISPELVVSKDPEVIIGASLADVARRPGWGGILSAGSGALPVPLATTWEALWGGLCQQTSGFDTIHAIVWNLRLPRVFMAALVGASLGCSGAAMQGLFRNPLADPYLLGVASGASFGATLALTLSGELALAFADVPFVLGRGSNWVPLFAFLGALFAVCATLALAQTRGRAQPPSILLAGIVVGSVLTSLTTYLMMRDADRLRAAFSWSLGNLAVSSWADVSRAAPYAALGMVGLYALARGLDALQLGEDTARTLGIDTRRVHLGIIIGASPSTAAAVSFVGIVGFVGLAAPHIMRHLGAVRHRALLPASALAGAILLVVADLEARVLIRPAELPVGIVTTLVGGPFFLWLLRRQP